MFVIFFLILNTVLFEYYLKDKYASIYGTNDDAFMASVLSGRYTGGINHHLIFIKSAISAPLAYIQSILLQENIYSYFIFLVTSLAYGSLLLLIKYLFNYVTKFVFVVFFVIGYFLFLPWFFINPTYTSAAVFAGSVGLILLFFSITQEKKLLNISFAMALVLIFFSISIRVESFFLSLLILSPIFMINILFFNFKIQKNSKIVGLIFLGMLAFIFLLENISYRSADWKSYSELNSLRHSIQLRTAEYALKDNLQGMNWSEYDYQLFTRFSLIDKDKLNAVNLKKAKINTSEYRGLNGLIRAKPANEIKFISNSFLSFNFIYQVLFLLALFILLTVNWRKYILNLLLLIGTSFGAVYILAANYHLPERITFSLLFLIFIGLVLILITSEIKSNLKSSVRLSIALVSSMFIIFNLSINLSKQLEARADYHANLQVINEAQAKVFNSSQDLIYVGNGSKIRESWQDPYEPFKPITEKGNIILLGWHMFSPLWQEKYSMFNFKNENIIFEILENNKFRWVESAESEELLTEFLGQYSDTQIFMEKDASIGEDTYASFKVRD